MATAFLDRESQFDRQLLMRAEHSPLPSAAGREWSAAWPWPLLQAVICAVSQGEGPQGSPGPSGDAKTQPQASTASGW